MKNALFNRITVSASALIVGLATAQLAHGETIVSVTQISYDNKLQPICQTVRMNPVTYGALPADACTLGTAGTDGPDRVTKNTYDPAGQLTQVDQAYGTPVQRAYARYTYTTNGLKQTERDANGNTTTYEYDNFDRLSKLRYPVTAVNSTSSSTTDYEQFGYDSNSNKTSWRRRDGNTISYTYDNLNRQIVKDMPGGSAQDVYTGYDALGHVQWRRFASTVGSGVYYGYDGLGRNDNETDMNGRVIWHTYNLNGSRAALVYPDSQVQYYAYLNNGLMSWSGLSSGAVAMATSYDSLGRLLGITRAGPGWTGFTYDGVGRLASMTQDLAGTGNDITWTFTGRNPAGQITKWAASSTLYDYKQIAAETTNKTYDGLNRDAGIAALSGGYDARGNMTFDGVRTFTYDLENRLLTESAPGIALSLEYDPEGRLSKITNSGSVTTFLYDGVNLIGEYDGASNMTKRYMHTLGTDQPWVEFSGSAVSAANASYYYTNYQGSVVMTADSGGNGTYLYKYGPYGEPKDISNADAWWGTRFRYTGQIMIPEAKLYYYKARVYDPIAGRFLQTDPVGSQDDLDLYAYVAGDPVNATDPTGMVIQFPEASQRGDLRDAINSLSRTQYRVDNAGRLSVDPNAKPNQNGSAYYSSQIDKGIGSSKTISVSVGDKISYGANNKEGTWPRTERASTSDSGGGVTSPDGTVVGIDGRTHQVDGASGAKIDSTPATILAHELAGHAVPLVTGTATGNAVADENKVRRETGQPERKRDDSHPEDFNGRRR